MTKRKYFIILLIVVVAAFVFMPKVVHAAPAGAESPLTTTLLHRDKPWVDTLYNVSKGLLNIALLIGLLLAAFATILKIDIDSYTIKKILPRVIIAAVVGNLILTIAGAGSMIVDKATTVSFFHWNSMDIVNLMGRNSWDTLKAAFSSLFSPYSAGMLATTFILIGGIIANFTVLVVAIAVEIMLALRPSIILFAAAVGPLALGLSVLPFAEPLFKKWYKILIFWIFYPLIANFLIYIIKLIPY